MPLYDSHYPKELLLNTVREFQLFRTSYPSMDEANNIPEIVNSFKNCIRRTVKTTFIDMYTVQARSTANLTASLTNLVLGDAALGDQLAYLRRTLKLRQLSIEDWIRLIHEINNLINYFILPAAAIANNNLVTEVIELNIPSHYSTKFKMMYRANDIFQQITRTLILISQLLSALSFSD